MNLNLQIIRSDLKDQCIGSHITSDWDNRPLEYASLYQKGRIPAPEVLYICPASEADSTVFAAAGCSFLFIGMPELQTPLTADYLAVREFEDPISLLETIEKLFQRYQKWQFRLQEAVMQGQDLEALAKISLKLFRNPMQFYNLKTLNCIFFVYDETGCAKSESLPAVDENGYMQPEMLLDLKIENILSTVAEKPMLIIRDNLTLPAIMQDIIINGSPVGRIVLFEAEKPLDERDMAFMTVFAEIIRTAMIHNPKLYDIHSRFIDVTLSGLLTGKTVKDDAIFSLLQIWNWNIRDAYFCLTARLPIDDRDASSLNTLTLTISRTVGCNCYLIHDDSIIYIFNLTATKMTRDGYLKLLLPVLRDNLLKAGISTVFHDFRKLYPYYRQALAGLQTGLRIDPSFWFFRFEHYALSFLADQLLQKMDLEVLYPEKLQELIELDHQKGNDYVHILRTWLSCNLNISETAKRLYMHRNTLLYKLDKIKEIMGSTLENYDDRLFLMLILEMRNFQRTDS